jgi:hypothetical protein
MPVPEVLSPVPGLAGDNVADAVATSAAAAAEVLAAYEEARLFWEEGVRWAEPEVRLGFTGSCVPVGMGSAKRNIPYKVVYQFPRLKVGRSELVMAVGVCDPVRAGGRAREK